MDDSNLLYYIVLGVIFVLSKIFGKKKETKQVEPIGESSDIAQPSGKKSTSQTFEDIFKELTGESGATVSDLERKSPLPIASNKPVLASELKEIERLEEPLKREEVASNMVGNKAALRNEIVFKRNEHYENEDEPNKVKQGVEAILDDYEGLRQAMVLKEVLDRRY